MSLSLVWSDRSLDHLPPPGHPERVERGEVMRKVVERWRRGGGEVLQPRPATREEIGRIHAAGYVERLAASAGHPAVLDLDTYTSPGSWDAALEAAGAGVRAVDRVLAEAGRREAGQAGGGCDAIRAAFALVRPPGHHALRDRAMGFCLLNNIAIAAAHALASGLRRVAIVDYDVHHGNGTQWAFYDSPHVLFVSLHQYPFYPQTGAAGECGIRDGEGFNVNIPVSAGATDADYLLAMEAIVEPVLRAYQPELLMLDVGYDAHDQDPLANMHVSTAGFQEIAGRMRAMAGTLCGGRVVLLIEGGYHLQALEESLQATVDVMAGRCPISAGERIDLRPTDRGAAALDLVRAAQARYWPTI